MNITLQNVGRRFNKEWIFRNLSTEFTSGNSYAILGPNGSGKSTLLSVLTGSLSPSEGEISFSDIKEISVENIYKYISLAAPYLELVETFTLRESIDFHFKFKNFASGLDSKKLITILGLEKAANKEIKYFSSGMKQRTKLALACCTDTPILFLDEPTSNLDVQGINWYRELIENFGKDRLTIIGSNQIQEYDFCTNQIQISDYK
ncbi:ABC transporter ATP-binding protein NatA [Pedobacter sp. Bi27]|uniref:ABC transporter ATP-binding protein n=1 Tax=unclassified Pedobacter TaxID=2628915 RepID=UPI001DDE3105|nr:MULTISPECIES: ABC transporter ATP-binding protein [unclassified Pedobacter]CAH0182272.1 ABC transporter ATP-binding protein NatA [Pedobacter sp. Bi36]CAH0206558.1 ABC transporter ATP-binding protein NatA [Pedobacter sp. Bi27]CAH0238173.1 ABC transporter ATP-binding protein NatA [Pedobacter sp. Bi126]